MITVTLLALIVALLVGLAAYTRIETAVAGTMQRQAQARENALLALSLAVGQLQRHAGPDQRVTATAEAFGHVSGTAHYTGVWDTMGSGKEPLTWLVSGNEGFEPGGTERPLVISAAVPGGRLVEVVGPNTMRASSVTAGRVLVPVRDLSVSGVPGAHGSVTIGRYAWWVGDQGVKAAIAAPDPMRPVYYAPYDSSGMRSRLRQQISRGAAPPDLEPLAAANAPLIRNMIAGNQLAFLRTTDGAQAGPERVRANFHAWTANNLAVLADTKSGGLRRDLSIAPELLGDAFAAWSDCRTHLEPVAPGGVSPPEPAYGGDPLRRRHRIMPPIESGGFTFTTAPVLSLFFLQFNIRRVGGNSAPAATRDLEVRARMVCQLWNPWTAALVPEDLRLEVSGLPAVSVIDSQGGHQPLNLQALFGHPKMSIRLTAADVAFPGDPDDRSWLPGRVYYWRTKGADGDEWGAEFYNRTIAAPNDAIWTVPAGIAYLPPAANAVTLRISGPATRLTLELRRAEDGALLATCISPEFEAFSTEPRAVNSNDEYRIGYPIRMVEGTDLAAVEDGAGWLSGFGGDPRATVMVEPMLRSLSAGARPDQYAGVGGSSVFTDADRLLDRVMGKSGMSHNEDVPLFELPRSPVLSAGSVQHLQVEGSRPFAVGNSWGAAVAWEDGSVNALFDRFFFSGLAPGVAEPDVANGAPLPNTLLRVLPRTDGHRATTAADLRANSAAGYSSRHLLQGGAFNFNAVSPEAWTALLRSGRFPGNERFNYLDASPATGSAGDAETAEIPLPGAAFFRFPQSAQETYKAEPGYAASTAAPPAPPTIPSAANTHLFRRGVRNLAPDQVSALAHAIVGGLHRKHAESGPFRSMEEFLNASPLFSDPAGVPRSLIEAAIAEAGLNAEVPEFSSQFLTQADLMNLLAPVLFPRSDTFVIRAYGEAVNPATQLSEGRAWCEAIMQRLTDYFDASQPPETEASDLNPLNRTHGRRFKVVSFRWLARADI
ncbi:MAG: hypothetical protein WD941_03855 [Opitutus sp.]